LGKWLCNANNEIMGNALIHKLEDDMNTTEIKKLIQQELPNILQTDKTFHYIIQGILQENFADKHKTDDRFEQMLAEIRAMREESERKWQEQEARWDKQYAENRAMREESERKWQEQKAQWDRQEARWDKQYAENRAMREESQQILKEIQLFTHKYNSNIGALGARWGIQTESAFRNALKSILEESFDMKVLNITEFDHEGEVFGRPDQVELDIIIRNGLLIICEIKSSMSKSDMYIFERKVRYYEKHHNKKVNRQIVISPMLDKYAYPIAEKLGIEVYSYAEDVEID